MNAWTLERRYHAAAHILTGAGGGALESERLSLVVQGQGILSHESKMVCREGESKWSYHASHRSEIAGTHSAGKAPRTKVMKANASGRVPIGAPKYKGRRDDERDPSDEWKSSGHPGTREVDTHQASCVVAVPGLLCGHRERLQLRKNTRTTGGLPRPMKAWIDDPLYARSYKRGVEVEAMQPNRRYLAEGNTSVS